MITRRSCPYYPCPSGGNPVHGAVWRIRRTAPLSFPDAGVPEPRSACALPTGHPAVVAGAGAGVPVPWGPDARVFRPGRLPVAPGGDRSALETDRVLGGSGDGPGPWRPWRRIGSSEAREMGPALGGPGDGPDPWRLRRRTGPSEALEMDRVLGGPWHGPGPWRPWRWTGSLAVPGTGPALGGPGDGPGPWRPRRRTGASKALGTDPALGASRRRTGALRNSRRRVRWWSTEPAASGVG